MTAAGKDTGMRISGLIAILRGVSPEDAAAVATTIIAAGFDAIEVPLNSPDPQRSITLMREALPPEVPVGAGTVLTLPQLESALDAGAEFVVAPDTHPEVIRAAAAAGALPFPGASTVSEVMAAHRAGATHVKVFPACALGTRLVREWLAVIPRDVRLFPVGGIDADSLAEWTPLGIAGAGVGSAVYRPGASIADIRENAEHIVAAWRGAV